MRGLQWLVDLRRRGYRPVGVAIDTTPRQFTPQGVLDVEAGDVAGLTDLRALLGLRVHVMGDDEKRVDDWARAACAAGAELVVAYVGEQPPRVLRAAVEAV